MRKLTRLCGSVSFVRWNAMLYVIVKRLFDEYKMMTEVPFNYIVLGENTSYLDRTKERKL